MLEAMGYVHTLHGEAMAGTGGELRFLHEGDAVYQDEIITTTHEGALEIRFLDNTILARGEDDRLYFDQSGGFNGTISFETRAGYDGHTAGGSEADFVLDTSTDMLFYDADGDGAGAGQEVCVLDSGYELDGSAILVA